MAETPVLDLKDLSKKLKISVQALRKYVKSGKPKAKRVKRVYTSRGPNSVTVHRPQLKHFTAIRTWNRSVKDEGTVFPVDEK